MRKKTLQRKVKNKARNLCANLEKTGNHCIKYHTTCPLTKTLNTRCPYFEKAVLPDDHQLQKHYKSFISKNSIIKTIGE